MELRYLESAQLDNSKIQQHLSKLRQYHEKLVHVTTHTEYSEAESSINLPFDQQNISTVMEMKAKKTSSQLKYIIDVGIGGSSLGTKAIYDALYGYTDLLEPNRFPKIIFVDTNDADQLSHILKFLTKSIINPEEVLINVITKSGKTTETLANMELIESVVPNFKDRTVITTMHNSPLWIAAQDAGIATLTVPDKVGGRYSVFTAVGLFPLACANVDILGLVEGAMNTRQSCLNPDLESNPATVSAALLFEHYGQGKVINDNFFFHPELESLGKWYRQLMGESIGKEFDMQGNQINTGITPTVSIGSTDLHSMGQLYLGGPKNKFFTLIGGAHKHTKVDLPTYMPLDTKVVPLENKTTQNIMDAIYGGLAATFKKQQIPFMEIILEDIAEENLGRFMQFKMLEMMYLGCLFNVNTFDQPNVESYKNETKRLLQEQS
ncbi:hypothetical protein KC980_00700 [candidate division WWE3 bacterium]|uniref:Glucose-6-phosphate isomerase n=1 Tax=candidate division WWE3 bacterium TaxID=2053526 RepID=A0A955ECF4_UNCKA|nr:hypothetical protein [candidate division WWE3 bacterium]